MAATKSVLNSSELESENDEPPRLTNAVRILASTTILSFFLGVIIMLNLFVGVEEELVCGWVCAVGIFFFVVAAVAFFIAELLHTNDEEEQDSYGPPQLNASKATQANFLRVISAKSVRKGEQRRRKYGSNLKPVRKDRGVGTR